MDNAVFETLHGVADSDGTIRTAAENRLKELATQSGTVIYQEILHLNKDPPPLLTWFLHIPIEFPVSLAKITVSQQFNVPQRQISFLIWYNILILTSTPFYAFVLFVLNLSLYLAALTLKSYVTTHWSSKSDEKFIGPEPHPEVWSYLYIICERSRLIWTDAPFCITNRAKPQYVKSSLLVSLIPSQKSELSVLMLYPRLLTMISPKIGPISSISCLVT